MPTQQKESLRRKSKLERHLDRLHRRQAKRVTARTKAGLCGHCGKETCIKGK